MSPAPNLLGRALHRLACWLTEGPCTRGGEWAPLTGDRRHHLMPLPRRRVLLVSIKRAQPIGRLRVVQGGRRWGSR